MQRSQAARTFSYAELLFALGAPLTTILSLRVRTAGEHSVRWQCGCSSVGQFRSMVWAACAFHARRTLLLREERRPAPAAVFGQSAGMRFGEHNARWSFDPANAYQDKRLREEYLSVLYACGTMAGDFFAAEVIYRELISNALRHAPGTVNVELEWSELHPILSVHDGSGLFSWTGGLPHNEYSERGRGLFIVSSLARGLRIKDAVGKGCKVSAVLPIERRCELANLFDFPNRESAVVAACG